jgi:hypothetical protein
MWISIREEGLCSGLVDGLGKFVVNITHVISISLKKLSTVG